MQVQANCLLGRLNTMTSRFNPRYTEHISIHDARCWLKQHFGNRATIPHGSKTLWVAGVRWVTDQPGCYLIAADDWGLEGVQVIKPAKEGSVAA